MWWLTDGLHELWAVIQCALVGHRGEALGRHRWRDVWVFRCSRCGAAWDEEDCT